MNNLHRGPWYGRDLLEKIVNPPPSIISRLSDWWAARRFDRMFWLVALALTWLSVMIAWAIVSIG